MATSPSAARQRPLGRLAGWGDERLRVAGPVRKYLNKVFPDHWSFMMGEIALYSFKYIEVHQPLGPVDEHGHSTLSYAGTPVPKRMNQLSAATPLKQIRGFFYPVNEPPEPDAADADARDSATRPPAPRSPGTRSR